jgi:uncharacterized repeat protein (TIGR03803 family)
MKFILRLLFLCVAAAVASSAQTFTSLANFDGTDGSKPESWPMQGTDGNLYGTALDGGAFGNGTVFKMTPNGTLTTLYSFCSQPICADGDTPEGGLTLGTDGNFYGATLAGGAQFEGMIYKITPKGALTVLYSFCSQTDCSDGYGPGRAPIQGTDGNFYGTTLYGGAYGDSFDNNYGTMYKLTPRAY